MGKGQKSISVTEAEYALINEGKELLQAFTKARISWGAYLCALAFGALAAKALEGFLMRCPNCGGETEMKLIKPKVTWLK